MGWTLVALINPDLLYWDRSGSTEGDMVTTVGKQRKAVVSGVVISGLLLMTGCQTTKQDAGTVIGGLLGAAAGSQFGDGGGRIVGVIVGAAAGAWIGNQIGQYLDEEDQKELAKATQTTAVSGETVTWSNPDTGVTGTTRVVKQEVRSESVAVPVLKDKVTSLPAFEYVGERYSVTSNSNVRGGPGTDYKVVGSIKGGQTVDVIGDVEGKPWYLIGENGVGNGFVFHDLLKPTGQATTILVSNETDAPGVESQQAVAGRNCRTIEQVVVLKDGTEEAEQVTACQGSNGWEIV